jgi:nucleoid-associated protein YgaU
LLRTVNIFPANDSSVEEEYVVENGDTWVYISHKFYNTMDLWWLVCEYNQIKNPTQLPEAGKKIKILKSDFVWTIITEINRQLKR